MASEGSTPTDVNKKNCKGTIRNPPPTPSNPEANPAKIPIRINPI
jgi:hypothetical protein